MTENLKKGTIVSITSKKSVLKKYDADDVTGMAGKIMGRADASEVEKYIAKGGPKEGAYYSVATDDGTRDIHESHFKTIEA